MVHCGALTLPAPPSQFLERRQYCKSGARSAASPRWAPAAAGAAARRHHSLHAGPARPRLAALAGAATSRQQQAVDQSAVTLLDLTLPGGVELVAGVALGCSSGSSPGQLLQHLQQALGCTLLSVAPWQPPAAGGAHPAVQRRQLQYATPLSFAQRLLLPLARLRCRTLRSSGLSGTATAA